MSQAEKQTVVETLDESGIAAYLEKNPQFLERHPDVLEALDAPHRTGNAESLIERQVAALRETNRALQQRYGQLVDTARDNEKRVLQINRLAQVFVAMTSVDEFVPEFTRFAASELAVDRVFAGLDCSAELPDDIATLPPEAATSRALTNVFRRGKPIVGALDRDQARALFTAADDAGPDAASAAMIPLGKRKVSGALVLASSDPAHFTPEMGTLFLELTGQLATTALRRLLGDDAPD